MTVFGKIFAAACDDRPLYRVSVTQHGEPVKTMKQHFWDSLEAIDYAADIESRYYGLGLLDFNVAIDEVSP